MHAEVLSWVGQFRTDDDLAVLDIGGRDLNGTTRALFPNANPYHVLDLRPGPNVDFVGDASSWVTMRSYDLVLITEVFEHTPQWPAILHTAWAALRPGGWLIFTCAGPGRPAHSGIEPVQGLIGDEWYANVAPGEIEDVLREQGWTEIETHLRGTDTQGKAVRPELREVTLSAELSRTTSAAEAGEPAGPAPGTAAL